MPIYKHSETGQNAELSREYVKAFTEGTWVLEEDEGPKEREDRELREMLANKVTVENEDGSEAKPETAKERKAREKVDAELAASPAPASGDLHPPAATIVKDQEGAK